MDINTVEKLVTVQEFKELRASVGWPSPPDTALETSLANTEFCITAYVDGELAGMGRIVGDKGFVYFIADIIVRPEYQGRRIGSEIMDRVMAYLHQEAPEHAYITLMAAKGKEEFYEKYGFFRRPSENYGCGMMIRLK